MRALITGASRGLGRAVAQRLFAEGAQLALVARESAVIEQLASELAGSHALSADLAQADQAEALVSRAVQRLGGLDAVVNCAGIVCYADALDVSRAELQAQLDVNFVAPFVIAQCAARVMRAAGEGGAIVNVASTLGLRPAAQTSAYAASKAALLSMTRAFALELGRYDIRVNAVAPGIVDTDMVRVLRPGQASIEAQLEQLRELHPLKRLGEPSDVAEAVSYLLGARFVTGSVLVVDGGLLVAS
jgi:NAD(P)-dependent dehydrogenase (short-subunit alcohol dehydrogenase family)